ncbi:flagellar biosynthetic protein FliO [Kineothrix sp. MB12-C1]|uniref:flagellar biosynthetic protein FliO n=1 Tax=Kineothrix sp. MB12-C1 TaxID=3070215 RepID=UPI0027D2A380|nr:flagellar biosynthetic protein FliO [Kineothrix sp. MB12-C1]WMC93004.1 flagellar biosynthetic protein FliO [Kineothrix sp. MB12-C1]
MNSFLQLITVLFIFVFVLVITWFFTRWMTSLQSGAKGSTNIEVIETYKLTANKYIQIVRTGDKYLAIAIGKDTVTMLAEIPEEQIHLPDREGVSMPDFKKIFEKAKIMDKDRKK